MRARPHPLLLLTLGCAGVGFPGSEQVAGRGAPPVPPEVRVADVRLAEAPSDAELAGHFCARVAPALVCRVFGPTPRVEDLRFVFDVDLEVANRNAVALPVVSALVAFTAYPSDEARTLGTTCLSLAEGAEDASGDACRCEAPEIRDVDDFAAATAGFLVAAARGEASLSDLRVRTVAPGDRVLLRVRLALDAEQMSALIRRVAEDAVASVARGERPHFAIPWAVEGSVWVEVERFGRFAASFGPVQGTWELER